MRVLKDLAGLLVPDGGLHLADVGLAQQKHTQPALADAAAHGEGQLIPHHLLMEGQVEPVHGPGGAELGEHGGGVHPDASRAQSSSGW